MIDGALLFRCAICGGPRTPAGLGGEPAKRALREAHAAFARATRARVTGTALVLAAALLAVGVAVLWPAGLLAKVLLLAFVSAPALLAARARLSVGPARREALDAISRANLEAAREAATKAEGATARELAERLGVPEAEAERLLVALSAEDVGARIDVDDAAEVRFRLSTFDAGSPDAAAVEARAQEEHAEEEAALVERAEEGKRASR